MEIDQIHTLFIDRDGVINIEKENDYIHSWDEFEFYDDATEAFAWFAKVFDRIIVVTNQKGIGKGVTVEENVAVIHEYMVRAIEASGGRIDKVYYCADTDDESFNRKPNPGMAYQAWEDFPEIVFAESVMIGNNLSDLLFGRNTGMHTVFLRTTQPALKIPDGLADMEASSLLELARKWGYTGT